MYNFVTFGMVSYTTTQMFWEQVATPLRVLFCKDLARYHTEWGILYYVRQP